MKIYNVIVLADDFKSVKHEQIITQEDLKIKLLELAPECEIDFDKIFTDKRCIYFRHYMPVNKTTTMHSYKENAELHNKKNVVKVYISERWHERQL